MLDSSFLLVLYNLCFVTCLCTTLFNTNFGKDKTSLIGSLHIVLWRVPNMLSKHFLFLFFLNLVVVVKSISTFILFVHNFFGKITTLSFCSNYIIYMIGFSNPTTSLFFSSQNLLPHVATLKFYLES